jgi:hypothetical protein
MKKQLFRRDVKGETLLATFDIVKGVVTPQWESAAGPFKDDIETNGIPGRKGRFKITDGKAFMNALSEAFQRSSFVFVR